MMVLGSGSDGDGYSPGDQDPCTGQLLMDHLEATIHMTPAGSPTRSNLRRNLDHWYETVRKMDWRRDWWQGVAHDNGNPTGAGLIDLVANTSYACGKEVEKVTFPHKACLQRAGAGGPMEGSDIQS